jgi:hypothetical protein
MKPASVEVKVEVIVRAFTASRWLRNWPKPPRLISVGKLDGMWSRKRLTEDEENLIFMMALQGTQIGKIMQENYYNLDSKLYYPQT